MGATAGAAAAVVCRSGDPTYSPASDGGAVVLDAVGAGKDAAICPHLTLPHLGSPGAMPARSRRPHRPSGTRGGESDRLARREFWFTGAFSFALSPAIRPLWSSTATKPIVHTSKTAASEWGGR